nr:MAG TPA: hypothetical protein [Caudoviricetes sp.]
MSSYTITAMISSLSESTRFVMSCNISFSPPCCNYIILHLDYFVNAFMNCFSFFLLKIKPQATIL